MGNYVISYDVGTTGVKTCLFNIENSIELIKAESCGYKLYILDNGGAEQDVEEWWSAMCATTKKIFNDEKVKGKIRPEDIKGISFCSQAQGLVVVDEKGKALRRAMSYMDQRAKKQLKKGMAYGPQIAGANIFKAIPYLYYTGAVSSSVKDPIWKYKWIEENEPEIFNKIYKWLDVKEYLLCRCTDEFVMVRDSAFAALLYDIRKGHEGWSKPVCDMVGVNMEHLPKIINSTDIVGPLTEKAAKDLGLAPGTPVFGGGNDSSLIGVGAGTVHLGETHIYSGTSGWVSTIVDKSMVDATAMIAAIVGAQDGLFNYFAELETSGKCLEWVKNHLALDEIDIYLEKKDVTEAPRDFEEAYKSLYDYMSAVIDKVPAGSNGVLFTPWLHGNRCPFEDPNAAGMFFNIKIETGKKDLIRSVIEGICYHKRWMLEAQEKKTKVSDTVRFVGGGALSDVTSQILADILGKNVETVYFPQNVGAVGAAAVVGVGTGIISDLEEVDKYIKVDKCFTPNRENKEIYDKGFEVFKSLYKNNKKAFKALNG
ncbi:MAG: FGGY-family carbohydrate kinase [Clostridia bacterium]|nr:FGGY-family carbohydrate kinase [Clostridia bacterium]